VRSQDQSSLLWIIPVRTLNLVTLLLTDGQYFSPKEWHNMIAVQYHPVLLSRKWISETGVCVCVSAYYYGWIEIGVESAEPVAGILYTVALCICTEQPGWCLFCRQNEYTSASIVFGQPQRGQHQINHFNRLTALFLNTNLFENILPNSIERSSAWQLYNN
jgi:hypothetical protein